MKVSAWARQQGIHDTTAWRWWRTGTLPVPAHQTASGTILVDAGPESTSGRVVVDARVSSHDQRADLDRQVAEATRGAVAAGLAAGEVVTEVGSGMNGRRRKLTRLLSDPDVSTIVVTDRDRLARVGVCRLEAALAAHGRGVVVIDDGEVDDGLAGDMTEVLSSWCARRYGRCGARNRAEKALRCAHNDVGPASPEVTA